jgi:hypothetical protein
MDEVDKAASTDIKAKKQRCASSSSYLLLLFLHLLTKLLLPFAKLSLAIPTNRPVLFAIMTFDNLEGIINEVLYIPFSALLRLGQHLHVGLLLLTTFTLLTHLLLQRQISHYIPGL